MRNQIVMPLTSYVIKPFACVLLGVLTAMTGAFILACISHLSLSDERAASVIHQAIEQHTVPRRATHDGSSECIMFVQHQLRHSKLILDAINTRFQVYPRRPDPCDFAYALSSHEPWDSIAADYVQYAWSIRHLQAIALSMMSYDNARIVYGIVSFAASILLFAAVWRSSRKIALIFAPIAFALTFAFALDRFGPSHAHAPSIVAGLLLLAIFVSAKATFKNLYVQIIFFGLIGGTVTTFDILNGSIPAILSLTIVLNYLFYARYGSIERALTEIVIVAASFALSYVLLTGIRQALLWALLDLNLRIYFQALSVRVSSYVNPEYGYVSWLDIAKGLWQWRGQISFDNLYLADTYVILSVCAWITAIIIAFRKDLDRPFAWSDVLVFEIASIGVLSWYVIFPNHAFIHLWLTSRIAALPTFYGMALLICLTSRTATTAKDSR